MMEKEKESAKADKQNKKHIVHKIKEHLEMKIAIPVGILLLILVLVLVRVPYTAKESYNETEFYTETESVIEPDMENPKQERVCVDVPANIKVEEDYFSPYIKAIGKEFQCEAEVRVWNNGKEKGKWTYKYVFNISGKVVETEPITKEILSLSSGTFMFISDECLDVDTVTGEYVFVSGPTTSNCEYKTVYPNKTVVKEVEKQRDALRERIITKYEPLWQKILGYNNFEKN